MKPEMTKNDNVWISKSLELSQAFVALSNLEEGTEAHSKQKERYDRLVEEIKSLPKPDTLPQTVETVDERLEEIRSR